MKICKVRKIEKQLNFQSQEIPNKEIPDVNNKGDKDNNSKEKSNDITEESNKRPIEVDTKETNTMQDKFSSKKAKKEVKNENS
ncbi:hypothetical protein Glove_511g2 [Diversispora epigaea]|uniref:Uncharacterized protein n=1 Tax=Diversispora epigaea TaxID=1348612 RepID=A0A397GK37_9GLOM|nr:hypothetical protein Glove_511g2 [Diversispora epigaea]